MILRHKYEQLMLEASECKQNHFAAEALRKAANSILDSARERCLVVLGSDGDVVWSDKEPTIPAPAPQSSSSFMSMEQADTLGCELQLLLDRIRDLSRAAPGVSMLAAVDIITCEGATKALRVNLVSSVLDDAIQRWLYTLSPGTEKRRASNHDLACMMAVIKRSAYMILSWLLLGGDGTELLSVDGVLAMVPVSMSIGKDKHMPEIMHEVKLMNSVLTQMRSICVLDNE